MRELALLASQSDLHIAARPVQAFHGNMQVAIAEARTLVEAGNRVVFFASSTGEIERLADILNEYGTAYQLGIEQSGDDAGISGRARLLGRLGRGEHLPRQGRRTLRGVFLADAKTRDIRIGRSVRDLRAGRASRLRRNRIWPPSRRTCSI